MYLSYSMEGGEFKLTNRCNSGGTTIQLIPINGSNNQVKKNIQKN